MSHISDPPHSVILQGNTHSPSENASAVLAVCGEGISLTSNQVSVSQHSNKSLIETGSDSSLFGASQVFLKGNTLNCALAAPQRPASLPSALRRIADRLLCVHADGENPKPIANNTNSIVRLRPTEKVYNGGTPSQSRAPLVAAAVFSVGWLLTRTALCTRRAASHLAPGGLTGHAPYAPQPSLLLLGQCALLVLRKVSATGCVGRATQLRLVCQRRRAPRADAAGAVRAGANAVPGEEARGQLPR